MEREIPHQAEIIPFPTAEIPPVPTTPNSDYEKPNPKRTVFHENPIPEIPGFEQGSEEAQPPVRTLKVEDSKRWDNEVKKRRRKMKTLPAPVVEMGEANPINIGWEDHFDWLDTVAKRRESITRTKEHAEIKIQSDMPIGIVLTSDWHIGAEGMDRDTFRRHMKGILDEPNAFMAVLSNTIDGYIWPGGMLGESVHIPEQIEVMKAFVSRFKEKMLCAVGSRCHDWTKERGGVSPQEVAFLESIDNGMPFMPNGGLMDIDLNGIKYRFGLMHKSRYNSSLNVTNPNKRMLDLRWPSADVVAIAHHHTAAIEHTTRWEGEDKRDVLLVRTGTYKVGDSYSESEGYGQGQIGSSIVLLDHREKRLYPFFNLEDGLAYLKNLRELEQYRRTYQ